MDNITPLIDYITRQIILTQEEIQYFTSLLQVKKLKRKQFLEQPGFVSKYRNHVLKGAFKAYVIGGMDRSISFPLQWKGGTLATLQVIFSYMAYFMLLFGKCKVSSTGSSLLKKVQGG